MTGRSLYTAGLVLILPDVLSRLDDPVAGTYGVVACVPACRYLAVCLIRVC